MVSTATARSLMASNINSGSPKDITAADVRAVFGATLDAIDRTGNGSVNVMDYGAVLNGVTDDTAAWNAALATGKTVYFPEGSSIITNRLEFPYLEGAAIVGAGRNKSFFLISHATFNMAATAVIQMNSAYQGLHGFCMRFVQPTTTIRANIKQYPVAININGHSRAELSRLRIEAATDGILAAGNCGGAVIDDIQIAALRRGAFFDGSYDSIRINRWHFWPFGLTADAGLMSIWGDGQTICMDFGKVDDLNISSILTYQGRIIFGNYGSGGVFGVGSNITLDADYGRLEFNAGEMTVSNIYDSTAAVDDYAIRQTGGELRISGLALEGGHNGNFGMVNVEGGVFAATNIYFYSESNTVQPFRQSGGYMTLSNGKFREVSNAPRPIPMISITGGRAVITGMIAQERTGGTGSFIGVSNDDHHIIAHNSFVGWAMDLPASPVLGLYGPNNNVASPFVNNVLVGPSRVKRLTGTLDGGGGASVIHGIADAANRVMGIFAYYTNASAVMVPIAGITFNATNVIIAAGASGVSRPYVLQITYT